MVQGLTQLEGLVTKVADVLHSRAESNLKAVQATRLVDLPPHRTFTQEEFASHQATFAQQQTERLATRSASCSLPFICSNLALGCKFNMSSKQHDEDHDVRGREKRKSRHPLKTAKMHNTLVCLRHYRYFS